jgi:hypothetical protein
MAGQGHQCVEPALAKEKRIKEISGSGVDKWAFSFHGIVTVGQNDQAMKRLMYSLILGCALTALLYELIQIPTSGPTLLDILVLYLFQIPTMLITKDRVLGEYICYAIQVLFFSVLSYGILASHDRFFHGETL